MQHRMPARIAKGDVSELNRSFAGGQRWSVGQLLNGGRRTEDFKKSPGRHNSLLILRADLIELLQPAENIAHRHAKHNQVADLQAFAHHQNTSQPEQRKARCNGNAPKNRYKVAVHAHILHNMTVKYVRGLIVFFYFGCFSGECLNHMHAGDIFAQHRYEFIAGRHQPLLNGLHPPTEMPQIHKPKWRGQERHKANPRVDAP